MRARPGWGAWPGHTIRLLALIVLAALVGAPRLALAQSAGPAGGTLVSSSISSTSLGIRVPVTVYLPPGYPAAGTRYPVLYLLHGTADSGSDMFRELNLKNVVDALIAAGSIQPLIVVAPSDGPLATTDTEWMNSRVVPTGQWGAFVSHDLVKWADDTYATCPVRTARSIGGISMGAFGALNAALRHLSEFGAVTLWSGYFIANTPLVDGPTGSAGWRADSPMYYLPDRLSRLAADPLRISFYVSPSDVFYSESTEFARLLAREHLPYTFSVYPGTHGYDLWSAHVAEELTWLSGGEHC